jgi:uncharacterized protein (TIGR00369 family)
MNYQELLQLFNKSPFISHVGLHVEELSDKVSVVSLTINDKHKQRLGFVHGGVIATMVDVAMGSLVVAATGKPAVSVEINVNYLLSASEGIIKAIAHLKRLGKRLHYAEADVVDDKGNILSTATGIYYTLDSDS